mgnify:CR=1 FL=1|jgi:hypothetical protein|tara:strand:- start:559 stop:927 length:369 start_codon:yes stop_codon:yes gene_type:complete
MAHFAKIENNKVTNVIVAEDDFAGVDGETWIQTSYNTRGNVHYGQDGKPDGGIALRGNYAGIGYVYDSSKDKFYQQQPYASWILDTNRWLWQPPITYPNGDMYIWDEDVYQADNTKGWVKDD